MSARPSAARVALVSNCPALPAPVRYLFLLSLPLPLHTAVHFLLPAQLRACACKTLVRPSWQRSVFRCWPTCALDADNVARVEAVLREAMQQCMVLLLVTHAQEQAQRLASGVLRVMKRERA